MNKTERLSETYPDGGVAVMEGDTVEIDGHIGVVTKVLVRNSSEAKAFECEDTGGLLIDLKISGETLIPFGSACVIRKHRD